MSIFTSLHYGVSASAITAHLVPIVSADPFWDYTLAVMEFESSLTDNNASTAITSTVMTMGGTGYSLTAAGGGKSGKGMQASASTAHIRPGSDGPYMWSLGRFTDFTWECFVYRTTLTDNPVLWYFEVPGSSWAVTLKVTANKLTFIGLSETGTQYTITDPGDFPTSEWVYICVERTGDTFRLYKAAQADTNTTNVVKNTTADVGFKQASSFAPIFGTPTTIPGTGWFANSGKMDGLRFTLAARYSSDSGYPVPTLPYPVGTVTQSMPPKGHLLWHFDAGSGVFSDVAGTVAATDGDTVGLWNNKGMREDAVQNTAARRPTFHTGGLNGRSYLQCDKTTQQYFESLDIYENNGLTNAYSRSIFVVAEDIDATSGSPIFGVSGSGQRGAFYLRTNADTQIHAVFGNYRTGNLPNPFIAGVSQNGNNDCYMNVNGAKWAVANSGNLSSQSATSLEFLRSTGLGAAPLGMFHGKIYEVLYYDCYLDATTRDAIVAYLMTKYGIAANGTVTKASAHTVLKLDGGAATKMSAFTILK